MYYVYILANDARTLYIGITNNLVKRVLQHRNGEGSQFADQYGLQKLVYYETFQLPADAIAREKRLKGWRRSKKIALIEESNPMWEDLFRLN